MNNRYRHHSSSAGRLAAGLLLLITLAGCNTPPPHSRQRVPWAETTATISLVEHVDAGEYAYIISYQAPESIALDRDNKPLKSIQMGRASKREPVNGQTLRIQYMRQEPTTFRYVDKMKLKE